MTATRYYVDPTGRYLGGFAPVVDASGDVRWPDIPAGAVEITAPPEDGRMVLDLGSETWSFPPEIAPTLTSAPTAAQLRGALSALGMSVDQIDALFAAAAAMTVSS